VSGITITPAHVDALCTKLDGVSGLSEEDRVVLWALLCVAGGGGSDDDTAGFAMTGPATLDFSFASVSLPPTTMASVRSQAEKRLEQQRKDLLRNWGG
jgi:hypothetical protein